jgi:hypothetical protein
MKCKSEARLADVRASLSLEHILERREILLHCLRVVAELSLGSVR